MDKNKKIIELANDVHNLSRPQRAELLRLKEERDNGHN